jgi:hypothetical protein
MPTRVAVAGFEQSTIVGNDIDDLNLRFRPARRNLVACLDLGLRLPVVGGLALENHLLHLFCWVPAWSTWHVLR